MPAPSPPFDVFDVPFEGVVRIEASAGTGKTHTLADLYLRLVAEGARSIDQILVVTYTVAATGELRDRIRRRLAEARAHFEGGPTDDPVLRRLRERAAGRRAAGRRLAEALRGIDEAAVFTIHGFCQRVLGECAFEGGQPFGSELLPDEQALLQEVVDDFWRRTVLAWSPLVIAHLIDAKVTPDMLLRAVKPHLGQPYLTVANPAGRPDGAAVEAAYVAAYQALRAQWPGARDAVAVLLSVPNVLNARSYPADRIAGWLGAMDAFLAPAEPSLGTSEALDKFTMTALTKATRKNQTTPAHPVFAACEALAGARAALEEVLEVRRRELVAACFAYATRELPVRKKARQLRAYPDLLTDLGAALEGPRGDQLAGAIRARYSAALIDEFQDTDPVQYGIFRRIYGGTRLPLILVGDPKQAIYGFRGADIFAYLAARKGAGTDRTLDHNWRADPPLVRALNTLWSRPRQPFVLPEISYETVQPAEKARDPLIIEGDTGPALQFWLLPGTPDGEPLDKGEAAELALRGTVAEIVRLLALGAEGRARIGTKPLAGGDLAVLVRSNRQGRDLRDRLLAVRVPAVQLVQESVFASAEAEELGRVLLAIAEPGREAFVRAALVTDLLGMTADKLEALAADEAAWEQRLEAFRGDHDRWQERGFARMMRELLRREGVPARLLRFPDGERRLTNLFHLVELLQDADEGQSLGMAGLVRWLVDRRFAEGQAPEEAQLRLESDENLVKIVTVHKSKGLEYPIVFCPFLWDGRLGADKAELFRYHDPAAAWRPTLDLGSPRQEEARRQARREELAEGLRLAYVALTRAKHRCYAVWGNVRDGGTSALAYLLHQPPDLGEAPLDALAAHVGSLGATGIQADLAALAQGSDGTIAVEPIPGEPAPVLQVPAIAPDALQARSFTGSLAVPWRITSFSGLIREAGDVAHRLDDDRGPGALRASVPATPTAAGFPRGARAGSCLHALLQRIDFAAPDALAEPLIGDALAAHGFDPAWTPAVAGMLAAALACPLDPDAAPLRLRDIGRADRLDELEFHYPVAGIMDAGLRRLLAGHGYGAGTRIRDEVERLAFAPVAGFMRGFIDLVVQRAGRYFVVDYKSNWLGEEPDAYAADRLPAVMAAEGYYLQSLIYVVALHRYLRHRVPGYDPERHLGGIYYLFLRGMDPQRGPESGVYRDQPDVTLLQHLDQYLATGEEA
jgi:exodeoxyribonuclease V beta subunit